MTNEIRTESPHHGWYAYSNWLSAVLTTSLLDRSILNALQAMFHDDIGISDLNTCLALFDWAVENQDFDFEPYCLDELAPHASAVGEHFRMVHGFVKNEMDLAAIIKLAEAREAAEMEIIDELEEREVINVLLIDIDEVFDLANFTGLPEWKLQAYKEYRPLSDFLRAIDWFFERDSREILERFPRLQESPEKVMECLRRIRSELVSTPSDAC